MNIDEAKKITTEHDALEKLAKRIYAFRDGPKGTGPEPELSIGDDLLGYLAPLVELRVKDLAALFETATPANPVPAATPPRAKGVKAAVMEKWTASLGGDERLMTEDHWKVWADRMCFKWGSVSNVLRELRNPTQMVATTVTSPK